MTAVEKLLMIARHGDQLIGPSFFEFALLVWIIRTIQTAEASLWPSGFGDNGPIAFHRAEEPREYWILLVLACAFFALCSLVLLERLSQLLS